MFIKTNGFKKLANEAYKTTGFHLSAGAQDYIIHGCHWAVRVIKETLSNKEKAVLVELAGDMPETGQHFSVQTKEGKQLLLDAEPWTKNLYADPQYGLTITPVIIQEKKCSDIKCRILRNEVGQIVPVNESFIDMIDEREVKDREDILIGPYMVENNDNMIFFKDRICTFTIAKRDWSNNENLSGIKEMLEGLVLPEEG